MQFSGSRLPFLLPLAARCRAFSRTRVALLLPDTARRAVPPQLRIYVYELPPWLNLVVWGEQLTERTMRMEGGYGRARLFAP